MEHGNNIIIQIQEQTIVDYNQQQTPVNLQDIVVGEHNKYT
jgi:hypothetical protein